MSITSLNFDLAAMMGAEADETRLAVRVGRCGKTDTVAQHVLLFTRPSLLLGPITKTNLEVSRFLRCQFR